MSRKDELCQEIAKLLARYGKACKAMHACVKGADDAFWDIVFKLDACGKELEDTGFAAIQRICELMRQVAPPPI